MTNGIQQIWRAALAAMVLVGAAASAKTESERIGEAAAKKKSYVQDLVLMDAKLIALGELASTQGQSQEVRDFGQKLSADHKEHLETLRNWAKSKAIEIAVIDLSAPEAGVGGGGQARTTYQKETQKHDEKMDREIVQARRELRDLKARQGMDFDKAFLSRAKDDAKAGVNQVKTGEREFQADAAFSALLAKTTPMLREDEARAVSISRDLSEKKSM